MNKHFEEGGEDMKIPIKYIIEIGLIRIKGKCANCGKKMDISNHNIQLCKKCRLEELKEVTI